MIQQEYGFITNTGFYGGFNDQYVPEFVFKETEEIIAGIWIAEFEKGLTRQE